MEKVSEGITPPVPAHLLEQIDEFIEILKSYNVKRFRPRDTKDYEFLRLFFKDFVEDRGKRASEVESENYQKVRELAEKQFPAPTLWNLCIDGRVLAVLIFGVSATIGSGIRLPGGMVRDFVRDPDAQMFLKKNSNYTHLLLDFYNRHKTSAIVEVFDSHIACAARLAEELGKGRNPQDGGLLADISHKLQMARAARHFIRDNFDGKKTLYTIQTSFDPHTGFLFMGLERPEAMEYARAHGGYTAEVLQYLSEKKEIISTELIESEEEIQKVFQKYFFDLDWEKDYVTSAEKFWEAITQMKKATYPFFEKYLERLYPRLKDITIDSKIEKEERLLLLLCNTFSGFLHSHKITQVQKNDGMSLGDELYEYGIHKEQGIEVSPDGYPPYRLSVFVVANFDEKNLLDNITLSEGLVRQNRLQDRVTNTYGIFENKQSFVESPVPIAVLELVREHIPYTTWKELENLSWDDLPSNWDEMSDADFLAYVYKKSQMPAGVMLAINNLRHRMMQIFEPGNPISSHFIDHYKIALPLIVGRHRRAHFVVPFIKLGFTA